MQKQINLIKVEYKFSYRKIVNRRIEKEKRKEKEKVGGIISKGGFKKKERKKESLMFK